MEARNGGAEGEVSTKTCALPTKKEWGHKWGMWRVGTPVWIDIGMSWWGLDVGSMQQHDCWHGSRVCCVVEHVAPCHVVEAVHCVCCRALFKIVASICVCVDMHSLMMVSEH
jgi:hypothetical protein